MSLNSLLVEEVDDKLGEVTSQAGKNIFTKKILGLDAVYIFIFTRDTLCTTSLSVIFVSVLSRIYGYANKSLT